MVLIYYAQVHHRWLPFKDNKGQNTANYFKEKDVTAQGGNCSHSILGWFSTDFRKLKILSKHLLPQGEGVLARASLIAVKVQCRPDFPLENLSMDVGPARQPRSPLAFPSGGWATFPTLGTVPHNNNMSCVKELCRIQPQQWPVAGAWKSEPHQCTTLSLHKQHPTKVDAAMSCAWHIND